MSRLQLLCRLVHSHTLWLAVPHACPSLNFNRRPQETMHKRTIRRHNDDSNDEEPSLSADSTAASILNVPSPILLRETGSSSDKTKASRDRTSVGVLSFSACITDGGCANTSMNSSSTMPSVIKSLGTSSFSQGSASSNSSSSSFNSEDSKFQSENAVDRKLFWSIASLLALAILLLLASALGLIIRNLRRGGAFVKPNLDVFDTKHIRLLLKEEHNRSSPILSAFSATQTNDTTPHVIPKNLIFVTDRLPGDVNIHPHTLENAVLWQEMYKEDYQMHFFPGSYSILQFFESYAPHLIDALENCETIYEEFDFARYVILYYLGGISVDIAVTRPLDRLDTLLHTLNPTLSKDQQLIIAAVDYNFEHMEDSKLWAYPRQRGLATHVWAATPQHPTLLQVIDRVSTNLLDRNSVDINIVSHGYPSSVLQNPLKAKLLRRTWTTGSGPFSDVLLYAVQKQRESRSSGILSPSGDQVIILPMETFMSAHPGGMKFRNIQNNHDEDKLQLIYMGDEVYDTNGGIMPRNKVNQDGDTEKLKYKNKKEKQKKQGYEHNEDKTLTKDQFSEQDVSPNDFNPLQKRRRQKNKKQKLPTEPSSTDVRRKTYVVYDESHLPKDTYHTIAPYTYLIGAVRDASEIVDTPFRYIVQLCCEHGVHVHIVVGGGIEECRTRFEQHIKEEYSGSEGKCGRFELLSEPHDLHSMENRVDRIAYLRDFQREHLRMVLENGDEDDIIVVADIDLYALPPVSKLMHEVNRMRLLHEYDVICSNGLMHRPYGYYDIYATVLLPDTFLYPIRYRLWKKSWEGEDLNLVRSDDEYGEVTSWDILDWIEQQGEKNRKENALKQSNDNIEINQVEYLNGLWTKAIALGHYTEEPEFEPSSAVPVKSCFGGLSIYSAPALLEPRCRYHPPAVGENADRLLKYANADDKRPCEHVVYHDCLYRIHTRNGGSSRIAIQPDMKTLWNNMPPPTNKLISDSQFDSLITFNNQADRADRLTSRNGLSTLYIDSSGILVVSSCAVKNCPIPQLRRISSYMIDKDSNTTVKQSPPIKNWSHMFLILESNANLILLKNVNARKLKKNHIFPNRFDNSCQLEVWSTNTAFPGIKQSCDQSTHGSEDKLQRFEMELKNDGFLEIRPYNPHSDTSLTSNDIIWRSNGIEY